MAAVTTGPRRRPRGRRTTRRHARRRALAGAALALAVLAGGACGDDVTGVLPSCVRAPRLTPGLPVDGRLETTDPRRAGVPTDYFAILVTGPVRLDIRMTSGDLDPFLFLIRDTGENLAQAFHPTGDPDVETVTLSRSVVAGCYLVGASAWSAAALGAYTLVADTAEAAEPDG